ncbi:MAG: aldehyde dehydrogenase family protein [Parcubacteria group bacterium]|nr:aldehyde dehydrogenase family protein [Parcubacteria group bacterium]
MTIPAMMTNATPPADMVSRARIAQAEWAKTPVKKRIKMFRKLQRHLQWHYEDFIQAIQKDTSKPWPDAAMEVLSTINELAYLCSQGRKLLRENIFPWPHIGLANKKVEVRYEPLPVIAVITPWNMPLAIGAADILPALFAGCSVIWKPSEYTPAAALKFVELFQAIAQSEKLPPNALQAATGDGHTGAILVQLADGVAFTGSTAIGMDIKYACQTRDIPFSLEMGGKAPAIVWPPVNLERAANAIVYGAFSNSGAYCTSIERLFVHESLYEPLMAAITQKMAQLRPDIDYGPIVTESQFRVIQNQIQQAGSAGVALVSPTVPAGGGDQNFWIHPTLIKDPHLSMDVMTAETFGPVLPVKKVQSLDDAITLANKSSLGLNAAIFTKDKKVVERLVSELQAGNITVNECLINWMVPSAPQCARKSSGSPLTGLPRHGRFGVHRFTQPKTVLIHKMPALFPNWELWWFPYGWWTKLAYRLFMHSVYPFI